MAQESRTEISPGTSGVPADTNNDGTEIGLVDILIVLAENLLLLTIVPLLVGLLALGYSFTLPVSFTGNTRILPPQQQQSSLASALTQVGGLVGLAGLSGGFGKDPSQTYIAMIRSRSVADNMVARFKLKERYSTTSDEDARATLAVKTRVGLSKEGGLIEIETDDGDPKLAAALANAYVEELRRFLQTQAVTEAAQRRVYFEKQLRQAKDNLSTAELALAASGVTSANLKTIPSVSVGPMAQLSAQVAANEIKLSYMRGYLAEKSPEVIRTQQELRVLRERVVKLAENEGAGKKSNGDTDYVTKYREYKYAETLFELLLKQFEVAKLDEGREGAVVQVIDTAVPPERKSYPKKAQMAIRATFAALLVMMLFVFVRHAMRSAAANPGTAVKLVRLRGSFFGGRRP